MTALLFFKILIMYTRLNQHYLIISTLLTLYCHIAFARLGYT